MKENFVTIMRSTISVFTVLMLFSCVHDRENPIKLKSDNTVKFGNNANFVTTWEVEEEGNNHIIIPINPSYKGKYNYNIKWIKTEGDISGERLNVFDSAVINLPSAGTYKVEISGAFPSIYFDKLGQKESKKIISVDNWGDIKWLRMDYAFYGCTNLKINALDAPDLENIVSMKGMFFGAQSFNQSINHWNVSSVKDLSYMFGHAMSFNQPLDNWDVSLATNMEGMFKSAEAFNQPLNKWNVSEVTNMKEMFRESKAFNQPIDNWNVSLATNMEGMFISAKSFNQSLNNWNVSNVSNMGFMFAYAESFNQPLNNWNVSNVTNMISMFYNAKSFNQSLNNWNVKNVTSMMNMFYNTKSFLRDNISSWKLNEEQLNLIQIHN